MLSIESGKVTWAGTLIEGETSRVIGEEIYRLPFPVDPTEDPPTIFRVESLSATFRTEYGPRQLRTLNAFVSEKKIFALGPASFATTALLYTVRPDTFGYLCRNKIVVTNNKRFLEVEIHSPRVRHLSGEPLRDPELEEVAFVTLKYPPLL